MSKFKMELEELSPKSTLGFAMTFISMIAIFLFVPLLIQNHYANLLLQVFFTTLILSVVYTLKSSRFILISGVILLLPFLIFDALGIAQDNIDFFLIAYSFLAVFLFFAMIILLRMILLIPEVDTNLVFGAITIYLLLGVFWGKLYLIVSVLFPNSFEGVSNPVIANGKLDSFYMNQFDLLYYSFTSLTTLGLGDIYPLHRLAKSLTLLEAVFGQLFLATVITKIVSVWKAKHSLEK